MAIAFAFKDRLTHLVLRLKPPSSRDFLFEKKLHLNLLSYLSKFKYLTSLNLLRSNDFKLEEIDEFLNICPRQRCQYFRSFDKLQTCNPTLSNDTTIEELYLYSSEVNPAALYQLSVRLSNLKIMSFVKNEFISFNRSQLKGKKTIIDMPYTNFDKLVINQKRHRNFLHFFLKYSNETGDRYFYSELEPGVIKLLKCTMDDYTDKLNSKKCYFFIFGV
ncbi:hypothetical protein EDC94DRAFT_611393 [Helicostylum pulchrum]|nr:hypothetical protein EDC94DRAFT_611393 [Helicostylum pulchrum]